LENFLKTFIGFKMGFIAGIVLFLGMAVFYTPYNGVPLQFLILFLLVVCLIFGFILGRSNHLSVDVNSEDWRRYYAYRDDLTGDEKMLENMSLNVKFPLIIGLILYFLGLCYLIISFIWFSYRLTPIDFISAGIGFIGLAIAMNGWKK
jgi:hypothetical protein